jgi:hypothetical protein
VIPVLSTIHSVRMQMSDSARPARQVCPKRPLRFFRIDGMVKVDGDKITFVADRDQKSWAVENPEALKPMKDTVCR